MADRGIIFSAAMVRALFDGRKTQTRRLVSSPLAQCQQGDRLWVREAMTIRGVFSDVVEVGYRAHQNASHTEFVEQWPIERTRSAEGSLPRVNWPRYRPSIHMPRWASRLTLIITEVRREPLQLISREDAEAEGIERSPRSQNRWRNYEHPSGVPLASPVISFASLWDSLHDKPGERWGDNPDLVALTFRVRHANIDAVPV